MKPKSQHPVALRKKIGGKPKGKNVKATFLQTIKEEDAEHMSSRGSRRGTEEDNVEELADVPHSKVEDAEPGLGFGTVRDVPTPLKGKPQIAESVNDQIVPRTKK